MTNLLRGFVTELHSWVEHPSRPDRLVLMWQAPLSVDSRKRWAVGELAYEGNGYSFRYYLNGEFAAANDGRPFEELKLTGYLGYPSFRLDASGQEASIFRSNAIEAFLRRLPPPSRADFDAYLAQFRIRRSTAVTQLGLLALTGARLPSDGFYLVDPLDPMAREVDVVMEVAGFRHHPTAGSLVSIGDDLSLLLEPDNFADPKAVAVASEAGRIGYVPRIQAPTVGQWLTTRHLSCKVVKLNGPRNAPRAFALLQVRPLELLVAA